MSYTSLKFIVFIIGLMLIYYIFPKKYRWTIILFGNLYFYYCLSKKLIIFVVLATLIVYLGAILLNKSNNRRKLIYLLTVSITLGFLIVLKYNNFLSSLINPIINIINLNIPFKKFILPIGISYYTLEMISYITDIYRKKYQPEKNYFKLLTFFTFFPKIVEGPISRYNELSKSLFSEKSFNYNNCRKAFILIGYGFIKKLIIADRAGIFVSNFLDNNNTGSYIILSMILYTIQIYMDFSGCIDIARGVSELFNIELPENFKRPFFSKSIEEFWRRWHISLGLWLKDYIFFSISFSKINMRLNKLVRKIRFKHLSRFITIAFPLFFVWFVNGLWHGASLKYIIYGLYYYFIMMLGVLLKPLFDKIISVFKINTKTFSYKLFQIIRTNIIVIIGMLLFRASTISNFISTIGNIFIYSKHKLTDFGLTYLDFNILIISLFVTFSISLASELNIDVRKKIEEQNLLFRWVIYLLIIFSIIIFGIYGKGYSASSFIYGGF